MKKFLFVPLTAVFLCLALLGNIVLFNNSVKLDSVTGAVLNQNGEITDAALINGGENGDAQLIELSADGAETESSVSKNSSGTITGCHGTTVTTDKDGNKTFKFTYNGKTYNSEFDRLMAEDGFIYGVDWDWFGLWTTNINALGDDPILGEKSRYRSSYVKRSLYNMHSLGINAMGTWLGPRSAIKWNTTTGIVEGMDPTFEKNLRDLLENCRATNMDLVPALLSHWDGGDYYSKPLLDRESSEMYEFLLRFYHDKEAQDAYFKNWVEPVCKIISEYQDVVPIVALTIENGTELNDIETGEMYFNQGLTWEDFATLNNRLHDTVKKFMPNVLTSIEDVGNPSYMYKYNDLKVDIISPQKYEADGMFPENPQWMKTRAGYLGEFNYAHGGDYMDISLDYLDLIMQRFYKDARKKGYLGAFHFMWSVQDGSRWGYFLNTSNDKYEDLRNFAVPVSYIINDLKLENRGMTGKDKPTLFYNNESTTSYWVGCRGAESYILERSDNGGDWKVIAKDISPIDNSLTNGLCFYDDQTLPKSGSYHYRVGVVYEGGEVVYGEPGNETKQYEPVERFLDSNGNYLGDFEKGDALFPNTKVDYSGEITQNADAFNWESGGKIGKVVDGGVTGKCLYGNTADGTSAAAGYGAQWVFKLKLTPGATHEVSFKLKHGSTGKICFSANPVIPDSGRDNQVGYIHSGIPVDAEEAEWYTNAFTFTAPESGQMVLYTRVSGEGEFWIDDLSVKEIR